MAQTFYTSHIDGECATVHNATTPARCHGEACAACHGTSVCLGVDCFRNSHAVAGALAACGALCLLVLTMRKRPLYDRIWYVSVLESICDTSTCDTFRSTCDTFVASSFDLNCEWCRPQPGGMRTRSTQRRKTRCSIHPLVGHSKSLGKAVGRFGCELASGAR